MQINKLEIENFKLFDKKEFHFDPHFNLVIGENGSGKTSLLRAVAVALGGWAHAYIKSPNNLRLITDDEIREIQIDNRFDKTKKTSVRTHGTVSIIDVDGYQENINALWFRSRYEGHENTATGTVISNDIFSQPSDSIIDFDTLGANILNSIEAGNSFNLPLIAFYKCDRLWIATGKINPESAAKAKYSRFDPYVDCFHTGLNLDQVEEWFLKHKLDSIDHDNKDTPILQSIHNAAKAALEGCTGLKFDFKQGRVIVEFDDSHATPFENLSDGQRTMVGLFCDLARRAAILNPHLEGNASAETAGVVLIDELDLHLHPKWQRRIIEDLRRTFPKIQFICTTHSPFLIQSLRSGEELIMLDGQPTANLADMSVDEIAQGIMGVENPQVSQRYEEMKDVAKNYLETLEEAAIAPEEKLAAFKTQLAKSIAPYADNPAFQAFLEMKRAVKLGE